MRMPKDRITKTHGRYSWALCNFGVLWGVYRTRQQAVEEAKLVTDEWRECFQIFKATVTEGW